MWLVGKGAEMCIDVRNEIVDEDRLESGEVEVWAAWWSGGIVGPADGWGSRDNVRGAAGAAGEGIPAELHDDDEGHDFSFGEEVVDDPTGVALAAPAGFV